MGISGSNGEYNDTNEEIFKQAIVSVTAVAVALVAGSPIESVQLVRIYNKGSSKMFVGPIGVTAITGEPLVKGQWIEYPLKGVAVYGITASGTADAVVTEIG